ncbi:MAG: hypothetical protein AB7E52_05090 [Bdellovibrionales bacterium]
MADTKELLGLVAFIITIAATTKYFALTWQGKIKPHVFTWTVWGLVVGISAAIRAADHAGPGAWPAWANAASCLSIAVLAFFKGEKSINKSDVICFILALGAIPLWLVADNPVLSMLIVVGIDLIGYIPTFRKSFHAPYQEATFNYYVANSLNLLSIFATEHHSFLTLFAPCAMILANSSLIAMLVWRRRLFLQLDPST